MAIGKNKRVSKGGKRGKKKVVEPMSRKEWYDVVVPALFKVRQCGKTIANKTIGTKLAVDNVMGRVYEANLADLNGATENQRDEPFRKMKFAVQDVQGRNLITQFHGMDLTTDRTRSLLKKWCTTIENVVHAKTADGYTLRIFVLAFTKKSQGQLSKNCYSKTRLEKWVRHRMTSMIEKRTAKQDITEAVSDLTHDVLSEALYARCNPILPLRDVKIRKVKVVGTPKLNVVDLMKHHGEVPASEEGKAREVEAAVEVAVEEKTA